MEADERNFLISETILNLWLLLSVMHACHITVFLIIMSMYSDRDKLKQTNSCLLSHSYIIELTLLDIRRTRLSTVGDRAFPVAAVHLWNSLPSHVTAAPPPLSLSPSSAVVLNHISSHFPIPLSDFSVICTVPASFWTL